MTCAAFLDQALHVVLVNRVTHTLRGGANVTGARPGILSLDALFDRGQPIEHLLALLFTFSRLGWGVGGLGRCIGELFFDLRQQGGLLRLHLLDLRLAEVLVLTVLGAR